ncbi:hypothetical protein B0A49_04812 [Cryomyces minteri]|uniref:Uncharacterized protein n=1 Tax=Cryomyces minteri TaxID=331657 RepID=A0A4U0X1T8_9PEZI|nr:hypothetical protein B0A49_04812 [Cryomyces minteri]
MPFLERVKGWIVHVLACCDKREEEERPLQIGHPTDFRREDISMVGLTNAQLAFIREKAVLDASRMDLQPNPLASHPSHLSQPSRWVKEHSRKISNSLRNGYTAVSPIDSTSYTPKGSKIMLVNHSSRKGFGESVDSHVEWQWERYARSREGSGDESSHERLNETARQPPSDAGQGRRSCSIEPADRRRKTKKKSKGFARKTLHFGLGDGI